jgi:mRNA interferase MazF
VIVAPVATRVRHIPSEVPLGPEDGLARPCVANLDTVATIAKSSLVTRIAALRPERVAQIEAALRFALGLD